MISVDSKIYIAGHTGLIGSALVRLLKSQGFKKLLLVKHDDLDLTDCLQTKKFFESTNPDYVVLAAGKVGGIVDNKYYPADYINSNILIASNVINCAHAVNVKKLIYFGSSCMYPRKCIQPMREDYLFSGIPEQTSMAYAVAKMAGLQMCLAFNQQYSRKCFIPVIPNSVYGPNDNFDLESGHVLSALIRRFHLSKVRNEPSVMLWGSGLPKREFIHSDDIANACLILLESELENSELPINIGFGSDISIKELAKIIANVVGYSGKIDWDQSKPDGSPRKLLDSSRMFQLRWRPAIDLSTGIKNTYQWYRENFKGEI